MCLFVNTRLNLRWSPRERVGSDTTSTPWNAPLDLELVFSKLLHPIVPLIKVFQTRSLSCLSLKMLWPLLISLLNISCAVQRRRSCEKALMWKYCEKKCSRRAILIFLAVEKIFICSVRCCRDSCWLNIVSTFSEKRHVLTLWMLGSSWILHFFQLADNEWAGRVQHRPEEGRGVRKQ